jgi:hypothetical protein
MMRVMMAEDRSSKSNESNILAAKKYMNTYLNSKINKPDCTVAWIYGQLSRLEGASGNEEQAKIYFEKAKSIKSDFSRASALPSVDDPPNRLKYSYSSYFRPF